LQQAPTHSASVKSYQPDGQSNSVEMTFLVAVIFPFPHLPNIQEGLEMMMILKIACRPAGPLRGVKMSRNTTMRQHVQKCNSLTCSYEAPGPLLKRVMRMSLHYKHPVDIRNLMMKAPLTLGGVPRQGRLLD